MNKNANKINIETFTLQNDRINFKANKNLQKSRENLKYLISQNDKEKLNKKKSQTYTEFAKVLFSKIKTNNIKLLKIIFSISSFRLNLIFYVIFIDLKLIN